MISLSLNLYSRACQLLLKYYSNFLTNGDGQKRSSSRSIKAITLEAVALPVLCEFSQSTRYCLCFVWLTLCMEKKKF